VIEETVRRGSSPKGSLLQPATDTTSLQQLGTSLTSIHVDPRRQEGRGFLGLLHEAGAATVEQRYARGEIIFAAGDPGNALYLLTEGAVKLSRGYSEGKEAILVLLGPWEIFGELAFCHSAYQHARAEAFTACRVRKVPKMFVERVVETRPEIALKVVDLLGLALARHWEMAGCLLPHKAEAKLANLLLILARRFGGAEEGRLVIRLRLTQEELAKMISSTRESVAQALTNLRRRGVLAITNRRIVILDSAGLAEAGRQRPIGGGSELAALALAEDS